MRNNSYVTAIRYTYKNGKFTINEGLRKSSFSEYGKILTGCTSLYLPERDDVLAIRIIIFPIALLIRLYKWTYEKWEN